MENLARKHRFIGCTFTLLASFMAAAPTFAIDPAPAKLGPLQVIPQFNVQVGHDDNIYSTDSNKVDSVITVVNPSVQAVLEKGLDVYSLNYAIKHGIYENDSADNYTDHDLSAQAYLDFNIRNRLELLARYLKAHEDRGSGLNQGSNATANAAPVEYDVTTLSAKYGFGAQDAKGRIEVAAELNDREYSNFRSQTAAKDRESSKVTGTFYYRVMPKTSLLFEIEHEEIDYDLASVTLDSSETEYLVGATWDATAKTTGIFKIGYAEKDFDSASREDDDGISWELAVNWAPKTYSVVSFVTSREEEETDGTGNYIDTTSWNLGWEHDWGNRIISRVGYGQSDSDYVSSSRSDESEIYGVGVTYQLQRWLDLGLDYSYSDRTSNQSGLDYDKNAVYFTVQGSL
ncbi:outer membrane beta-barrel protein [Neptuniibacter sp. QD72_48]|uniref:outer membrane beta-barrel protein n=1 Tax=unclassified Neptuniibacter TaxID=2630693 RepID=UPI0039F52D56